MGGDLPKGAAKSKRLPVPWKHKKAAPPPNSLNRVTNSPRSRCENPSGAKEGDMMKHSRIAALTAALACAAQPALAAELHAERGRGAQQRGAFAGVRIHVPLGETSDTVRAGIALTPTVRTSETAELRFGKGLEVGLSGKKGVDVFLAGKPVRQLASGRGAPADGKAGLSTIGWVAVGVGVTAAVFLAWFTHEMNSCEDHDDEC